MTHVTPSSLKVSLATLCTVVVVVVGGVWRVDASVHDALARERATNIAIYATRTEVADLRGDMKSLTESLRSVERELGRVRTALDKAVVRGRRR